MGMGILPESKSLGHRPYGEELLTLYCTIAVSFPFNSLMWYQNPPQILLAAHHTTESSYLRGHSEVHGDLYDINGVPQISS